MIQESNMDQPVIKPNGKEITELKIDPLVLFYFFHFYACMKEISTFYVRFTRVHNSKRKTARIILPKKVKDDGYMWSILSYLLEPGVKERERKKTWE